MSEKIESTTTISDVDIKLDEILGTPGAENVMLPVEEEKPNLFTSKKSKYFAVVTS